MAMEVTWEVLPLMGIPPSPREGHTMLALDESRILLLGGAARGPQQSNDTFVMDLTEGQWLRIVSRGDPPSPRTGLSAIMLADKRRVMIFGGSSMTEGYMNDVYVLDTTEWVWSKIPVKGEPPSPRDKHTACLFGSKMYVFGGFGPSTTAGASESSDDELAGIDTDGLSEGSTDSDGSCDEEDEGEPSIAFTWFNDLHSLDMMTMEWQKIEAAGLVPTPRAAHTAVVAQISPDQKSCVKDTMVLFGGRDSIGRQNDLFFLNLGTLMWEKMGLEAPPPRSFHAMVLLAKSQQAVCYGGLGANGEMFPGLELLNLRTMEWASLRSSSGLWPPLRGASAMVATLNKEIKLIIFGGSCSLEDGETLYYNDAYSVDVSQLVNVSQ